MRFFKIENNKASRKIQKYPEHLGPVIELLKNPFHLCFLVTLPLGWIDACRKSKQT
jgi:hypothetical protein